MNPIQASEAVEKILKQIRAGEVENFGSHEVYVLRQTIGFLQELNVYRNNLVTTLVEDYENSQG